MKHTKNSVLSLLLAGLLAGSSLPVRAANSAAVDLARQLNEAFVEVADKVSPTVVVIKTTHRPDAESESEDGGDAWGMVPPQLRRFFEERGTQPRGRRSPHNFHPKF